MIYNTIQYVVDNGIGTLTFNRPTVANGLTIEMCKEILEVLDQAHNDVVFVHCLLMLKARYSLLVAI